MLEYPLPVAPEKGLLTWTGLDSLLSQISPTFYRGVILFEFIAFTPVQYTSTQIIVFENNNIFKNVFENTFQKLFDVTYHKSPFWDILQPIFYIFKNILFSYNHFLNNTQKIS